jgi:phospholipid N-methyltransferase
MDIWAEYAQFFREFRRQFHHTGAILPSGRFLARALTRPLRGPRRPGRVLEVGPGTGSVTREIARRLLPGDRLDAVELNGNFVKLLRERLRRDRALLPHLDQIQIIHAPVEELLGEAVYDYIVSGLPFNNFTVAEVRRVFAAYKRLLRPGGILTFFEYGLVRQLKTPFVSRPERRRLFRVGRVVGGYIRDYQVRRERIFINVPPAIVRHLQLKPAPGREVRPRG